MNQETELKKAWNLIIDYCDGRHCGDCILDERCVVSSASCERMDDCYKIEVSNE